MRHDHPPPAVSLATLQFLAWVAERPRSYAAVMEAWRSTCPRLSVWEDACLDGLVAIGGTDERIVVLTARGRAALEPQHSATPAAPAPAAAVV
ncbi:MAG: hypothetical protein JNK11_01235 [Alphaproteobacteria bacterium]|nr:hypothetical protein [Alphaproteobacteria bacterium]